MKDFTSRPCVVCGDKIPQFSASGKRIRRDRIYCKNLCRVNAQRQREIDAAQRPRQLEMTNASVRLGILG